jgi:tRNA uridine 5-carboxymethylaminomethyl modification enzyme
VYPNGLSGPFPVDVQTTIIRSIAGLQNAVIMKPGYDVEYDYVDPTSLRSTLETKKARCYLLLCGFRKCFICILF